MLGLVALEAIALLVAGKRGALFALLPGVFLLLALRAALTDAGWQWVALWLTASLPAHLWDLKGRLRGGADRGHPRSR